MKHGSGARAAPGTRKPGQSAQAESAQRGSFPECFQACFRKILAPIKIELALPPPQNPKDSTPKTRNFVGMEFFFSGRKRPKSQVPTKSRAAIFTDSIFLLSIVGGLFEEPQKIKLILRV